MSVKLKLKLKLLNTGQSEVGWHRHGTMLECPQKYAYAYVMQVPRSSPKEAPFLGTLVHVGLAHYYLHLGLYQRSGKHGSWAKWQEAVEEHAVNSPEGKLFSPPDQQNLTARAVAILKGYITAYGRIDSDGIEVLKVEYEIRTQIDGELYTQRADLIVRDRKSKLIYIWDHKTAGGFGLAYGAEQYTLSGQILGLEYLGRELYGSSFGGVLLNMISTKKPGEVERVYAGAAPDSQAQWLSTLRYARERIRILAKRDPLQYPRALNPTVCYAYGGCDHYERCRWGSEGD